MMLSKAFKDDLFFLRFILFIPEFFICSRKGNHPIFSIAQK